MSAIEYSLIFLSIIVGLVIFIFISRWSLLIKNSRQIEFSLVLILWSLTIFFYLIFRWYWDFFYYLNDLSTPGIAVIFLIRPIILYFCVDLLMPENTIINQSEYFNEVSRKFFVLISVLWSYELFIILLWGKNLFELPRVLYLVNLALSVTLIFIRNKYFVVVGCVLSFGIASSLFIGLFFS
jgi:hypothetical protein